MKKYWFALFFLFFPLLAQASSSMTFAPPPSDVSVIFLGNIFGIVDGVLHGTGSQIMGAMFGVFNAAVLALGGIVIMYTLIVGTMNTAHEGQMLGQKWSSIWIPVRSTIGLALLIPKASGYCLMQIMIMWIVVQGVGAADKIWETALDYLNRGGVIIQANMKADTSLQAGSNDIASGASVILNAQVCMAGLQKQLETQRTNSLNERDEDKSGQCQDPEPGSDMEKFCNTSPPDLINSVNIVAVQNQNPAQDPMTVQMPNVDPGSVYAHLNGVCGTLSWRPIPTGDLNTSTAPTGVTSSDLGQASMSRAIALQQMYMDLSNVARSMVLNDPQINTSADSTTPFSPIANEQFGVAFLSTGYPCQGWDEKCTRWGPDPSSQSAPLFNGTEFQGAIADYNGIMLPTLRLINESKVQKGKYDTRAFIETAKSNGWMMAGSYFFNLVWLNGNAATSNADQTDSNAGLGASSFDPSGLTSSFDTSGNCSGTYKVLCNMFDGDPKKVQAVETLIDGLTILNSPLSSPNVIPTSTHLPKTGVESSTSYGFINNSVMVRLPDQPGVTPPKIDIKMDVKPSPNIVKFKSKHFNKSSVPGLIASYMYNTIFLYIVNIFLGYVQEYFLTIVYQFISVPIEGIGDIFEKGVAIIQEPGVNPVIALAKMGTSYINFSMDLWVQLLAYTYLLSYLKLEALLALLLPLLFSWLGIMVGIGFITAYYIPFLPYMIFTFGTIAWLMAVIESMVAGPIVALGITHPEGDGALGKGEQALMILMNVFLRPAMMIIGYISGIALCYVSVWIINTGFTNVTQFMTGKAGESAGYINWASAYAGFFCILIYTMLYLTVVEKAFTMIYVLPDKVLRWIGGQQETLGADTAQWGQEVKGQVKEGGDKTAGAGAQQSKILSAETEKQLAKVGITKTKTPEVKVD